MQVSYVLTQRSVHVFKKVTMKFYLVLALTLACTSAATIPELALDLGELNALIPGEKISQIVGEYMFKDSEFRDTLQYFSSDEFKAYWKLTINTPEFAAIVKYIANSGYDFVESINAMASALDYPLYEGDIPEVTQARSTMGFVEAVIDALPQEEIREFIQEKVKTSPVFRYFYERMTSLEFRKLVINFFAAPDLQDFWKALAEHGYDPIKVLILFTKVLGI